MNIFLETLLVALLLAVFFQDLKLRAIHIALPILIAILGVVLFLNESYPLLILWTTSLFLVLTFFGLYIYLSLKQRKLMNPLKSIGLGDFLFFFAVIPYFSTANYILYFVSGMLFSIFSFLILRAITKTNLVPLAGLLAFYMVLLRCISYVTEFNFFETRLI